MAGDYTSPCGDIVTTGSGSTLIDDINSAPIASNMIGYLDYDEGGQGYNQTNFVPYGGVGDPSTNMTGPYGTIQPWSQYVNGVGGGSGQYFIEDVDMIHIPFMDHYTSLLQSRIAAMQAVLAACPNGTVYLHYQNSEGAPAQSDNEFNYVHNEHPIVTYQVNAITIKEYRYELDVTYVSGNFSGNIIIPYFWYSTSGCVEEITAPTVIQNIEDEFNYTLAYSETLKGWTSFRSYLQESGVSLNNEYFTFKNGNLYAHHTNEQRNNFYGTQYDSYVDILLNRGPSIIKSFRTVGYEGTQARITQDTNNAAYYDNENKDGWYVSKMMTDLQEVDELEFTAKENKYFSQIRGVKTIWTEDGSAGNIDPREFSFQGIGSSSSVDCPDCGPTISWNCMGSPCGCVPVAGSQGQYPTQLACESDTSSCCGSVETWCFVGDNCIDPGDGTGPYGELCDCIEENLPCDQGSQWLYDCLQLPAPSVYVTGCMDDGVTSDPFITQNRPSGWIGPATNYNPGATVPDCSCIYETLPTYNCLDGDCVDPGDGSGAYTGTFAYEQCINNCENPCEGQNMGLDTIITNPTPIGPTGDPCSLVASDGAVSITVTNNNATRSNPFTSWTVEYYDSIWSQNGPPTMGALVYSDTNIYATRVWSITYI